MKIHGNEVGILHEIHTQNEVFYCSIRFMQRFLQLMKTFMVTIFSEEI